MRRMLANYLITSTLFVARQRTEITEKAIVQLYPSESISIPKTLEVGFLQDVVNAHLLGWFMSSAEIRAMIERSRNAQGQVIMTGCQGTVCPYKAYQSTMSIDRLVGIFSLQERQRKLAHIIAKLENQSRFGHVRAFGLTPKELWQASRCDYFCSVKHWTVMVTLNHLLNTTRPPHQGYPAPIY
jgi:hypothetical protein